MGAVSLVVDLSWDGASGSPGVNVWHLRDGGGGLINADDINDLSQAIFAFYVELQGLYPTPVHVQQFGEANGVGDDSGSVVAVDPWGLQGTGGTDFLPPANCILASWKASTGGRSGRGRTFLGPMKSAVAEDNGTPDDTDRGTVQTAMDNLIDFSTGFANGAVGIWSPTQNVFRDIVIGNCPNYFAVLRSRRD